MLKIFFFSHFYVYEHLMRTLLVLIIKILQSYFQEFSLSDFHIDYKLEKHKPQGGPCRALPVLVVLLY